MKKVATVLGTLSYFAIMAKSAFAAIDPSPIQVNAPTGGYKDLGEFITNVLSLAFGFSVLLVLIMLVWGAFDWITSGGDKDAVGKARGRIINALVGLAVLAVSFALARVAGQFLGFDLTAGIPIPTPKP